MSCILLIDYINNKSSICDVNSWFVDCRFEASSLGFGRRHLVFLEPEVTIFGREAKAASGLTMPDDNESLEIGLS